MHPSKVDRRRLANLTDLPNVGESIADDLRLLGYATPAALKGADPLELYRRLCEMTGAIHDPCVLDAFMSITDFLEGAPPRPWWEFTAARTARLGKGGVAAVLGEGPRKREPRSPRARPARRPGAR